MEPSRTFLKQIPLSARGFTLVEMLVVLAIIVIVTAVVLIGQQGFNRSILLVDTAYTVALSIRQTQTLGLSSRIFSGVQNLGYGVHFADGEGDSYLIFGDIYPGVPGSQLGGVCRGHTVSSGPEAKPGNCLYDASQGELFQSYSFTRGFRITSVCGHTSPSTEKCLGDDFDSFTITFLRPNTESIIVGYRNSTYTSLTDACIMISAPDDASITRSIFVSQIGEVSVLNSCP